MRLRACERDAAPSFESARASETRPGGGTATPKVRFAPITGILLAFAILLPQNPRDHLPFLTQAESDYLAGEISGDRAFEHDRWYTHWHRPFASEGLMAVARYTEEKAKELGLSDVKLTQTPHEGMEWTPHRGELWLTEPTVEKLCDIGSVQLSLLDRSRTADVTTEIVDVGAGVAESDYTGKEVKGKLAFGWGSPGTVMREAV